MALEGQPRGRDREGEGPVIGRTLSGLLVLNALFLVAGLALFAGLRGWRTWLELIDSLGLALMLGIGSISLLATLALIAGAGLSTLTILILVAIVVIVGVTIAAFRRAPLPVSPGRRPGLTVGNLVAAVAALGTIAILVALFRVARSAPMGGGDSFEFWVPKAKVIYFFGTIDSDKFTSLISPRYPLLVPALQAIDFRSMGSAYGPDLGVQDRFLFAGFVLSASFLLRRVVSAWLAWGFVALAAAIPELDARVLGAQADWALDLFYALAGIAVLVWLQTGERWLIAVYAIFASAAIATKQEGLLILGCLVVGVLLATLRRRRAVWPTLVAASLLAYAINLPWRVWWGTRDLPVTLPTMSFGELMHHWDRVWPSLALVLHLLFSYDRWLAFVPIALAAAIAGTTLPGVARETAIAYITTAAAVIAGLTYILWDDLTYILDEHQSSTPIPRAVGSIVLLSTVLAPLLIQPLLRRDLVRTSEVPATVGTKSLGGRSV